MTGNKSTYIDLTLEIYALAIEESYCAKTTRSFLYFTFIELFNTI